jgi:methionine-rich copper-binding protein CopC
VRTSVTTMTKGLLAVIAGALCATFWAAPASAHNSLTGSDPKNGATVAEPPETVMLSFLATVDADRMKVEVAGPDGGSAVASGPRADGRNVVVALKPGAAGKYTVTYEIVSEDGHPVKGRVDFTANAGITPSADPVPSTVEPPPSESIEPDLAGPQPADEHAGDPPPAPTRWPYFAGLGTLLLVSAGTILWLYRRRRS